MTSLHPDAPQLIQDLLTVWAFHFAVATLLMFAAKGSKAFRWERNLVRSVRVNWTFVASNMVIMPFLVATTIFIYKTANAWGLPRLPDDIWGRIPVAVQVAFALIAVDFLEYWEHRIKHKTFLWPLHGVHHSETEMNFMSWQRIHILDGAIHHVLFVLLGLFFGLGYVTIAFFVSARALHQQYVHLNIDWTHGPLEKWIASPRFHRWHHVDEKEAYDKNFALIFPIWDHLFGTYYSPGSCEDKPTGFENNPGDNFIALTLFPFQEWGRMIGRVLSRRKPDNKREAA